MALTKLRSASIQDYVNPENIRSDLMSVALQQAITENKTSYNLPNAFVDQFEDATGIDVNTNSSRRSTEYVESTTLSFVEHSSDSNTLLLIHSDTTNGSTTFTDSGTNSNGISRAGNTIHSTAQQKIGASSIYFDGSGDDLRTGNVGNLNIGSLSNTWTIEFWAYKVAGSSGEQIFTYGTPESNLIWACYLASNPLVRLRSGTDWSNSGAVNVYLFSDATTFPTNEWHHIAFSNSGGSVKCFYDGTQTNTGTMSVSNSHTDQLFIGSYFGTNLTSYLNGYLDEIRISNVARYTSNFSPNQSYVLNSSGNFTSTTQTANQTVSNMGIVVLYKDNAGTATLNTDLIAQVSADGGSNYSTCTLESVGNFSASIKIARAVGVSVTAGTSPKYKISFANQSAGSKETEVHGVGLLY